MSFWFLQGQDLAGVHLGTTNARSGWVLATTCNHEPIFSTSHAIVRFMPHSPLVLAIQIHSPEQITGLVWFP